MCSIYEARHIFRIDAILAVGRDVPHGQCASPGNGDKELGTSGGIA